MQRMARTPNLFIPGSCKCGTTSLHFILGQHPDIHAPCIKEPCFFCWPQVMSNPIAYFKLFDSDKRYRLDASISYLVSPGTAPVLRSLFPDARFIVTVRDPKKRAYSLFRVMRQFGVEDIPSFLEALKAEPDRFASAEFSQSSMNDWAQHYCRSSLYDEQLARYFALFDRRQIHIISLAELSRDPLATTERILEFLDLDPAPARHFNLEIKNQNTSDWPPYDAESDRFMSLFFDDLTERTDRLVGRQLDWSM